VKLADLALPPPLVALGEKARRCFPPARGSHGWDHTLRVARLCQRIGSIEGADPEVLLAAALLHDIGRERQDGNAGAVCHAEAGADMAQPLLAASPFRNGRLDNILHCIRAHRFRRGPAPATIEARVLFDADKIDAIGAVGVARAYLFAGEVGARLHAGDEELAESAPYSESDTGYREFRVKLRHIRERMLTAEGRRLAEERHRFMEQFFRQFILEIDALR